MNENDVELEEELIIDTSEDIEKASEEQVQNTRTYSEEEVEQIKKQMIEDNQKAWNKRWGQEKSKMERDFAKQNELAELLMKQTGHKSIDDLLNTSYEEYGMERPKNTRDEERLGKLDAEEILELDDAFIEQEANRLATMNRSVREDTTFKALGKYLTDKKAEAKRNQELKESGIEESVFNSDDFKSFMSKFNENTSLKDIGEMYSKMNSTSVKKKPYSAGSLKNNQIKETSDTFTEEEFMALTAEDLKDPKVYEKAMKSRYNF